MRAIEQGSIPPSQEALDLQVKNTTLRTKLAALRAKLARTTGEPALTYRVLTLPQGDTASVEKITGTVQLGAIGVNVDAQCTLQRSAGVIKQARVVKPARTRL